MLIIIYFFGITAIFKNLPLDFVFYIFITVVMKRFTSERGFILITQIKYNQEDFFFFFFKGKNKVLRRINKLQG